MIKKAIAPLVCAALFLGSGANTLAQSQWQSKVQPELVAKLAGQGDNAGPGANQGQQTYRVIVNITQTPNAKPIDRFGPSKARLAQISRAQDAVIAAMSAGAAGRVLNRYRSIFAFSAALTSAEIENLARRPDINIIEEMPVFRKMDVEAHALTGVDQMHAGDNTGKGSVIAIIDDGIDHDHPAFGGSAAYPNAKILGGYDFADNDTDPRIDCLDQSHGTATTGVAVGNGGGVTGTAPDANVVFLKVQASSECGQPSLSGDVAAAIDWVVTNKTTYDIDIISMSLGGGSYNSVSACDNASTAYRNAVDAANAAGIVVLAASGNDGLCNDISHPSCMSNVISVGATYDDSLGSSGSCVNTNSCAVTESHPTCAAVGMVACFDTAQADGVTCYSNSASFLDILAPSNCATTAQTGGGVNTCFSGTSSATPYAAGLAASLLEAAGGSGTLNNDAMRNLLAANGVTVTDGKNGRDTPRVDAVASVNAIGGGGGGGGVLSNGVPVNNLSAAQGNEDAYTIEVPSGATNLDIQISGGTGDADLYVRFGAAPTTTTYDCRPYLTGNNESCPFTNPAAGTWHVMLRAYAAYTGVSLVASYTVPAPNNPPLAGFTSNVTDLTAAFTDTSSDSDGSIVSRSWTFGDGNSSTATNPSHTYATAGTYTVTLTVTDDDGATDNTSASVTVTDPPNVAPVASFTSNVTDLSAAFTDTSSDSDGTIVSRSWTFGDGNTSTATNPSHTYATAGTYTVTLTVTDNDGATDGASASVTATAPTGAPCTACTQYSGSLTGAGDWQAQPNGTYYESGAGTQNGWLEGPETADFDLELYYWTGSWTRVASSLSVTSSESISYNGAAGFYYWRILSYSGAGSYDFWLQQP